MFFLLSKILSFLVSPTIWIFLLVIIALSLRKNKIGKRLGILALILFVLFTNGAIFYAVSKSWEEPYLRQTQPKGHFTYGIVLGGMATYDTISHRTQFAQSADRLLQTLPMLKDGIIDTLVISGGSAKILDKERFEAAFLKEYCVNLGFNSATIIVDSLSRNTVENAQYASKLISHNDSAKLILITSSYHLPRALACFRKYGINAVAYGTDAITPTTKPSFEDYTIPNIEILSGWNKLIHEWIGYFAYWLAGKI